MEGLVNDCCRDSIPFARPYACRRRPVTRSGASSHPDGSMVRLKTWQSLPALESCRTPSNEESRNDGLFVADIDVEAGPTLPRRHGAFYAARHDSRHPTTGPEEPASWPPRRRTSSELRIFYAAITFAASTGSVAVILGTYLMTGQVETAWEPVGCLLAAATLLVMIVEGGRRK